MLSFAGGVLGKIASRYGAPWKWAKAAKLVGAVGRIVGTVTKAIKDIFKVGDEIKGAERALADVCRANSFVPGTTVRLANGRAKPIEKIKVGDKVLAGEPKTGRTRAEPVVATIIGVGHKNLVSITTAQTIGKHPNVIVATAGHPFWTPDTRTWTNATDLTIGDRLSAPGGKTLKVRQIQRSGAYQQARNLTIAHLHTYYVLAGATPVLVHNCPEDLTPPYARKAYKRPTVSVRSTAIGKAPTCPYCGSSPSVEFEHVSPQKADWDSGGWLNSRDVRSARVNEPNNTTGACKPCNSSKQDKPLGDGPGKWWPSGWPTGVWWPYGGMP